MKTVLTIAGSDSSAGAGIQADIKTITAHGLYATSAITALTAQNTMGVAMICETRPDCLAAQIDSVCEDIYPDAVKIGMVFSKPLIEVIAKKCEQYKWSNIVLDPVMVSTSGHHLLKEDAQEALIERLVPKCDIVTPNIPEMEQLTGQKITGKEEMLCAAKQFFKTYHKAVLVKAGHCMEHADDLLVKEGVEKWYGSERIDAQNTHGTGCTLSSAIACHLALGENMEMAVQNAKNYVTGAIRAGLNLGKGSGPLYHMWEYYSIDNVPK